MDKIAKYIDDYIEFCRNQKRLDYKTIKAYKIDLQQYANSSLLKAKNFHSTDNTFHSEFITNLHKLYLPKTVKRKIASIKAFFKYLYERKGILTGILTYSHVKFREPKVLPKTIELHNIKSLLSRVHQEYHSATSDYKKKQTTQDILILELLIGTGMRISELCSLKSTSFDLHTEVVKILGKGSKERIIAICNSTLLAALKKHIEFSQVKSKKTDYFFINKYGNKLSEQSVRHMIKKYTTLAGISQNITPHMFRHTFATLLLEQDVDIRYIQKILGHSSISITEIYTYVSNSKQREILLNKNPRDLFKISECF